MQIRKISFLAQFSEQSASKNNQQANGKKFIKIDKTFLKNALVLYALEHFS